MKPVFRLQRLPVLLAAMILLLCVSAAAADSAQGSSASASGSAETALNLTVYPDSTSSFPAFSESDTSEASETSEVSETETMTTRLYAHRLPVILIVSVLVLAAVISVSVFVEKHYRNQP